MFMVSFWMTLLQGFSAKKNQALNIIKRTQILSIKQIKKEFSKSLAPDSMILGKVSRDFHQDR